MEIMKSIESLFTALGIDTLTGALYIIIVFSLLATAKIFKEQNEQSTLQKEQFKDRYQEALYLLWQKLDHEQYRLSKDFYDIMLSRSTSLNAYFFTTLKEHVLATTNDKEKYDNIRNLLASELEFLSPANDMTKVDRRLIDQLPDKTATFLRVFVPYLQACAFLLVVSILLLTISNEFMVMVLLGLTVCIITVIALFDVLKNSSDRKKIELLVTLGLSFLLGVAVIITAPWQLFVSYGLFSVYFFGMMFAVIRRGNQMKKSSNQQSIAS
ncbi:hypothetical protein [Mangrovibacillus cuniculi]|uniref:Uncharacterized protein n=1 Tax=Mangrovibacillus cuniculi TaxID=2593652 RepID=A0A7S8HGH4_9BACI|nr:hypothetical protein [Mangrovibacillus cuniculi]QPC47556.1 hypothetical protein G8O30_11640 [Mangrovibacillus cuniculi]